MSVVEIVDHPLIQHKISLLRDRNTGTKEFRDLVSEIAMLLCYEATRDLPTEEVEVETPVALARTKVLAGRKLALVPILRAGLGMVDGAMQELTVTGTHTTAELLESAGLTYTSDDLLTPAADEIVPEGSGITVQRVTYNEYTVDEVVPTEIEEIPTSLFYRKQSKVMTLEEGHDGQDAVVYREKWIDGEWAETNEVGRVNEAAMMPTVQKIYGEQAPVSGFVGPDVVDGVPVEGVAATYTGQRATGYSASATAKGASGRRLTYGTVAINPGVIPYGSLLYITSDDGKFVYGYAYAADTGTALVQGKAFIDLYYETYEESVENAVIPVTVYVLDDETAARYKEQNDAILEADTVVGR